MADKLSGLFIGVETLDKEIEKLKAQRQAILQEIAEATCPFKVGQTLRGKSGLAATGVVVQEITVPQFPSRTVRWEITTFALTKSGEVSKRVVAFSEWYAKDNELKVKS